MTKYKVIYLKRGNFRGEAYSGKVHNSRVSAIIELNKGKSFDKKYNNKFAGSYRIVPVASKKRYQGWTGIPRSKKLPFGW